MQRKTYGTLSLLLLTVSAWSVAQDITSFVDGRLAFESVSNGLYQVEWMPSLLDTNDWSSHSPFGMIVATGTSTTATVPVFYRVNWLNPPPYDIQGEVRHGLDPVSNIQVRLLNAEGMPISNSVSAANGAYSFSGLTNGDYAVCVDAFSNYLGVSNTVSVRNADATSFVWLPERIVPAFPINGQVLTNYSPTYSWESHSDAYWSISVQQLTTTSPPPAGMQGWWQFGITTNQWQQPEPLPAGCRYNWMVKGLFFVLGDGGVVELVPFAQFEAPVEFETEQ